jgi:hypothetical protein
MMLEVVVERVRVPNGIREKVESVFSRDCAVKTPAPGPQLGEFQPAIQLRRLNPHVDFCGG